MRRHAAANGVAGVAEHRIASGRGPRRGLWSWESDGAAVSVNDTRELTGEAWGSATTTATARQSGESGSVHATVVALGRGAWPTYQHDVRHTGCSASVGPPVPMLKWSRDTGGRAGLVTGSAGTLYLQSDAVYAIDPDDGTTEWSYPVSGACVPATGHHGRIYVTGADELWALNPDRALKWRFTPPLYCEAGASPMTGLDGTVFLGNPNDVYIRAATPEGTLKWSTCTYGLVSASSAPAVAPDGRSYVGGEDCSSYGYYWYAILARADSDGDLTPVWEGTRGRKVTGSPAIAEDGTAYFGSNEGRIHAYGPGVGIRWWFAGGAGGWTSYIGAAIGADGTVYVGGDGMYALTPAGTNEWVSPTGTRCGAPVIDAEGTICVQPGNLYTVHPDGTEKWRFSAPGSGPLAIGDDGTLCAFSGGVLHAIGNAPQPATGRQGAATVAPQRDWSDELPTPVAFELPSLFAGEGKDEARLVLRRIPLKPVAGRRDDAVHLVEHSLIEPIVVPLWPERVPLPAERERDVYLRLATWLSGASPRLDDVFDVEGASADLPPVRERLGVHLVIGMHVGLQVTPPRAALITLEELEVGTWVERRQLQWTATMLRVPELDLFDGLPRGQPGHVSVEAHRREVLTGLR